MTDTGAATTEPWSRYCRDLRVFGTVAQCAEITLRKRQGIWCHDTAVIEQSPGIAWNQAPAMAFPDEPVPVGLSRIDATNDNERLTLGGDLPGEVAQWDLTTGELVCADPTFLAGLGDITIQTQLLPININLSGRSELVLHRCSGRGLILLRHSGDTVTRQLVPGQTLRVQSERIAALSHTVQYRIPASSQMGWRVFGPLSGVAELTGPGWVVLQSLPTPTISSLAHVAWETLRGLWALARQQIAQRR